ncbi:hypothetical protein [Tenacibaculum amylolyticum]|uniref:hypothetical protein n=1 Tax=Tenacibaculum amylolyticum TaxID=104269 RepID=UPI0038952E7D
MKTNFLLGILLLLVLTSCDSDTEIATNPNSNTQSEVVTVVDKITRVNLKNRHLSNYEEDQFLYNDKGLISKIYLHGYTLDQNGRETETVSGRMYEFVYGANGKVSEYYIGEGFTSADLQQSIINSNKIFTKVVLEYDTNKRLVKETQFVNKNNTFEEGDSFQFLYDFKGIINKIVPSTCFNGPCEERYSDFDNKGNPLYFYPDNVIGIRDDKPTRKLTYDDSLNPLHLILSKAGLTSLEGLFKYRDYRAFDRYYRTFPNNFKEVLAIRANQNLLSVTYEGNENGYPLKSTSEVYNILFRVTTIYEMNLTYKEVTVMN